MTVLTALQARFSANLVLLERAKTQLRLSNSSQSQEYWTHELKRLRDNRKQLLKFIKFERQRLAAEAEELLQSPDGNMTD